MDTGATPTIISTSTVTTTTSTETTLTETKTITSATPETTTTITRTTNDASDNDGPAYRNYNDRTHHYDARTAAEPAKGSLTACRGQ